MEGQVLRQLDDSEKQDFFYCPLKSFFETFRGSEAAPNRCAQGRIPLKTKGVQDSSFEY